MGLQNPPRQTQIQRPRSQLLTADIRKNIKNKACAEGISHGTPVETEPLMCTFFF